MVYLSIVRVIDNPEHYFWEISSGGYDYVEVYKEKLGKTNTFKEVGYYKLYKAPKGDPNCGHDFQWKIDRKTSALRPFGINHCVAFKKNIKANQSLLENHQY